MLLPHRLIVGSYTGTLLPNPPSMAGSPLRSMNCKKGNGNRVLLEKDEMAVLQKQINLTAELAINLSRDVYCRLLRTVRAAIYLWTQELMAEGIAGEHNHYSPDERAKVAHLDDPEKFWRRAMDEVDSLPIPDVRVTGFFERVFGRAG